jgi:hypothetical protein
MAAPAPIPAPPPPESRYPGRDITFARLASVERGAGAANNKFIREFRRTCFHFNLVLSPQQVPLLDPPRNALVAQVRATAPSYVFPKCFVVGRDLHAEQKVAKSEDFLTDGLVKFEWKQKKLNPNDSDEEPAPAGESDEEAPKPEEDENEDELVGEYNAAAYEDQETGDGDAESGSEDND